MRPIVLLIMFVMVWPVHQAMAQLSVDKVVFGVHPDKVRTVFELNSVSDFRTFVLSNPYRVVIDMPEFAWRSGVVKKPPGTQVSEIRQGVLKPGISRIVMDTANPVRIKNAFILPADPAHNRPDRLVIDYAKVSVAEFEKHKHDRLGTLTVLEEPEQISRDAIADHVAGQLPSPALPSKKPVVEKPLIVIDPGHGGVDPGAIGANKVKEKHITLAISREIKQQLEATGRFRVRLTRERDYYIKLYKRVMFARQHDADLFLSIHADSIGRSHVKGMSFYTLSEKSSDKQTERLAARENRSDIIAGVDLTDEGDDVANILIDLAMRDTMNQSKFFANTLVDAVQSQRIRVLDNPHRYAGFAVLKAPDIPSVLVETGFLSNRNEAYLLSRPEHQRKIASGIVRGIVQYFDQLDRLRKS